MRSTAPVAAIIVILIAANIGAGDAKQCMSYGNEFLVSRDFSEIAISGPDAASASLYIDPMRNVSNVEGEQLRQFVIDSLRDKVQIADSKEHANYWLQILFQDHEYPVRNPNHEFARGSVVFAICKYPVKEMVDDCETLTYFYFSYFARRDLFQRVFTLWMDSIFPINVK